MNGLVSPSNVSASKEVVAHTTKFADARFSDTISDPGLTLSSVLSGAWRQKFACFSVAIVSFAVAAYLISSLQPRYASDALLIVNPTKTNITNVQSVEESAPAALSDLNFVRSQMQILTSDELARQVVTHLNLQDDTEFSATPPLLLTLFTPVMRALGVNTDHTVPAADTAIERATAQYKTKFGAFSDGKSFIIDAFFTAANPALAQRILTTHLALFQENQIAAKRQVIMQAEKWFSAELKFLQEKLQYEEAQQQAFRQANQLIGAGGETTPARQLTSVTNQLSDAQADLARKEARYRELSAAAGAGADTAVLASDLIQKLRQQEAVAAQAIAQLQQKVGQNFPPLLAARAGLDELQAKTSRELSRLTTSAASDVAQARANVQHLQEAQEGVGRRLGTTSKDELTVAQRDRDIEADRHLYETLLLRSKQVSIQAQLQEPDARVVSSATLPLTPAFPRRGVLMAISAAASLIIGGLSAFLIDLICTRRVTSLMDLEAICGVAGLAVIPRLPTSRGKKPEPAAPGTYLAAALHMLRNSVAYRCVGSEPKVTVFASSLPGEGKTMLALLYARSLAFDGRRVLLIDADLRRFGLTKLASAEKQIGLADCLMGHPLSQCVKADRVTGLDILPAGVVDADPSLLLAAERVASLIGTATKTYATVVIDTSPMTVVDDALHIIAQADATVLVARWKRTTFSAVQKALGRMHLANGNVVGAVLTDTDMRKYHSGSDASALVQHKSYYLSIS